MPEIVQANVVKGGIFPRNTPGARKMRVRLIAPCTGNNIGADAGEILQHLDRGAAQMNRLRLVSFTIWEPDQPPLPINLTPLERRDLSRSGASKQRQSQPGSRERSDLPAFLG